MKKLVIFLVALLLVGCSLSKTDKYASYRSMTDEQLYNMAQQAIVKAHYRVATNSLEALDFMYPFGPILVKLGLISFMLIIFRTTRLLLWLARTAIYVSIQMVLMPTMPITWKAS